MTTGKELAGARVLVTGASAGIGRAAAIGAVRQGARVMLAARRRKELDAAVAEAGGGEAIAVDLTRPADCDRLGEAVTAGFGGLDVVISCAGAAPLRMMIDTSEEHWEQVLTTNPVTVGDTFPTDFGNGFDGEVLAKVLDEWGARGLAQARFMTPGDVARTLLAVAGAMHGTPGIGVDHLTIRSPSPRVASFMETFAGLAEQGETDGIDG